MSSKSAKTDHAVLAVIARRFSPRAYDDRPVPDDALGAVLEAARWSASSFNEQPWRFVVGVRGAGPGSRFGDDATYRGILDCLVEGNRAWAAAAPVLMLTVARATFTRNDEPNRHAWHDVGMASAQAVLQATELGLGAHMMAGFVPDRARETFAIGEGFDPVAAVALGYPGDPDALPENLRAVETGPRERRGLDDLLWRP